MVLSLEERQVDARMRGGEVNEFRLYGFKVFCVGGAHDLIVDSHFPEVLELGVCLKVGVLGDSPTSHQ
jgi:hypothetical protein